MAKVFAKWYVEATRQQVQTMIEEGAFYIQVYQTPEDDNSDTIYCDDSNNKVEFNLVRGGKLDGAYEVILTGEASGVVLSPGWNEDTEGCENCHVIDQNGKETGEACDFGPVTRKTTRKKKA